MPYVPEPVRNNEPSNPGRLSGSSKRFIFGIAISAYVVCSLLLFFTWINPSLTGENRRHIAADSGTYLYFADSLREGRNEPFILGSLSSFPNTLWAPVFTALLLPSTLDIVFANYAMLGLSLWLFTSAVDLDLNVFLGLILLNITSTITFLSVNKEIFDLLVTALFVYYLSKGKRAALIAALVIALINRYEVCVAMLLFLGLRSGLNPFRKSRWHSLVMLCMVLSVLLSLLLASPTLAYRLEEAVNSTSESSGLIVMLDQLELHYLFFLAVLPKIMGNFFAELINVSHWQSFSMEDPANTFVIFGNNLATLCVFILLIVKRRFSLRSEWFYYAAVNAVMMSTALVIQPRYFYGCYILLCLEAARARSYGPAGNAMKPAYRMTLMAAAAKPKDERICE